MHPRYTEETIERRPHSVLMRDTAGVLAERFLNEFPLTYPSVDDADRDVFNELRAAGVPSTAFYDRKGKLAFLHQGVYRAEGDLHKDIEQYLGVS